MADTSKIHPSPPPEAVPAGAPPSTPLIPSSSVKSDDHGDHEATIPPPPRRRLFRYICCTLCILVVLLILLVVVFAAVLFLAFHPKIPHYSINGICVTSLSLSSTTSTAALTVDLTARNPNKRIGIYYDPGSLLAVSFNSTDLCRGSLPGFFQGHRNTTVMQVAMSGKTDNSTALAAELLAVQTASGGIPLGIRGEVPVRLKMGKLKLMKMKFTAKCQLGVNSLSANNVVIKIKSSNCKIKLKKIMGISF